MPRHGDNYWLEQIATVGLPGGGAGTQYADGAVRATATGTLGMVDDGTNVQSMAGDTAGNAKIVGNVDDATTDSGFPVKVGAMYRSTAPTYTNGQRSTLLTGTRGSLRVELYNADSAAAISSIPSGVDASSNTAVGYIAYPRLNVFNGTTWDRLRGSVAGGMHTNVAATPTVTTVSVATASTSVLASNTNRKSVIFANVGANNIYLNLAGGTAVATNTLLLPNEKFVWDRWVSTGAITGIAATGATNLSVTEIA